MTTPTNDSPGNAPRYRAGALTARQVQRLQERMGDPFDSLPPHTAFTALMRHGGLPVLLDQTSAARRLAPFLSAPDTAAGAAMAPDDVAQQLEQAAQDFFRKLVNHPGYIANADLISYITFPFTGKTYESSPTVSPSVPAVFTFVGQFIDHDLTMNAVDLFTDQTGPVRNGASPLIDLDSVYGPRTTGTGLVNIPTVSGTPKGDLIFHHDGKFKMHPIDGTNGFDLNRTKMSVPPGPIAHRPPAFTAHIFDSRNDENQLILQIHILLERVHNKLIDTNALHTAGKPKDEVIKTVRREVVANWQTVVLQDYLPRVIEATTLTNVLTQIRQINFGNLKHKPLLDLASGALVVQLPHEWAIGFRFGHSQLRPSYHLNAGGGADVKLFDNLTAHPGKDDLRGSVHLPPDHVIDWAEFYPDGSLPNHTRSLRIDSMVTPPVFNLPESAIPDSIKTVGNLPQRNLVRGRSIGVVSGEELYDFYVSNAGGPPVPLAHPKLTRSEVEPNTAVHHLFTHDLDADGQPVFKTPLWYYIIKEAELQGGDRTLGALGSRLVAEVVSGAIFYDMESVYFNPQYATAAGTGGTVNVPAPTAANPSLTVPVPVADAWTSVITGGKTVTLRDLIDYVNT
jgi:hypothetical protein